MELWSRVAEATFRYSKEEVVGQNISFLMPPKYAHAHDGFIRRYLETGEVYLLLVLLLCLSLSLESMEIISEPNVDHTSF